MTLEQFIKLFILQKNAREYSKEGYPKEQGQLARQEFEKEFKYLMATVEFESCYLLAPSLYPEQPQIPYVLFKPQLASAENPVPTIIHTHGGPNVYMHKDVPHAEIAYFISQGFNVVCPNYRGSNDYPDFGDENDRKDWQRWEKDAKDKYHIYGPQDVYAVTKAVMNMPFIAQDKVYLRGGSFGSFINAHLLAEIKTGTYENIYQGAHLSGGKNYPVPSSMPENIPLLITHAKKDKVSPFADVGIFMEKMLLKQLAKELQGIEVNNLQTFVSETGGHHLIDPKLSLEDTQSLSYKELVAYLKHAIEFFNSLAQGKKYQPSEAFDQYKKLMIHSDEDGHIEFEIFRRIYAYQISSQLAQKNSAEETQLQITKPYSNTNFAGTTCALLKLQLEDQYISNIKIDLEHFLRHHFKPIDWKTGKRIADAGERILGDTEFFDHIVQVVEYEESFMQQNPGYMIEYHTAESNTLQLYAFINLWQSILLNRPINALPVINEMRLYEFMNNTFDDINVFLLKMRPLKDTNKAFNYVPGFKERAISCNPSLISNSHNTAVSSLWLYFDAKESKYAPIDLVVSDFLYMLGIYSSERVDRYLDLFARELSRLHATPQALLQQLFVPYSIAENKAYMCQIWGEEFKDNLIQIESPNIIKKLINNPFALEEELRENKEAYTNFGNCEGFGDLEQGFKYANCLQLRYLLGTNKDVFTFSNFRNLRAHQEFVVALSLLIQEDYADFLASCNTIPNFIVKGADTAKQTLISQTKLGIFKRKEQANLYAFELQQLELYKGLVQNPSNELYSEIFALSKEDKSKVQEKLKEGYGDDVNYAVYAFSLCWNLKGYTYYDLLQEAAEATLVEDYSFVMAMIDSFSTPSSMKNVDINEEQFSKLERLFQDHLYKYAYDSKKHDFFNPNMLDTNDLWNKELLTAIDCVAKHIQLAKWRCEGRDIETATEYIYSHKDVFAL